MVLYSKFTDGSQFSDSLQVTAILVIQENSGVIFKRPVGYLHFVNFCVDLPSEPQALPVIISRTNGVPEPRPESGVLTNQKPRKLDTEESKNFLLVGPQLTS